MAMTAGLGAGGDAIVAERARERNGGTADPRHAGTRYQFERTGYFVSDTTDSTPERPVFNRTVTLRDTWAKIASK